MTIPEEFRNIKSYNVVHLPIISRYCDMLNISNIVDKAIKSNMEVSPGDIVKGLIINTLSGRDPLYRVEDFFEHLDSELLIGPGISKSSFNDDNIGRILDRIYKYGSSKIFSEISLEAIKKFELDMDKVHQDTTSVSVWGEYAGDQPYKINKGYSKDKRPDLNQFIISLICTEKDIPLSFKIFSGNEDDKTISKNLIKRISHYMSDYVSEDIDFVYTADSALISYDNLAFMGGIKEPYIKFISRMPATFSITDTVIEEAISVNQWEDIGKLSEQRKKESAYYKSYNKNITINGIEYRAIVIHSDFYDKRKQKSLKKEREKDLNMAEQTKKKLTSMEYYCKEDAINAAKKAPIRKYHNLKFDVVENKIYKKGRPKNGVKEISKVIYKLNITIEEDQKSIDDMEQKAGCFVMISNIEDKIKTPKEILSIYKEQHGIEKNFGFLKDPLIVNDLFLKKKERIEALGLILILSLLVWRLIERDLRKFIDQNDLSITGWDNKQTKKPTTFMMITKFAGVNILKKDNMRWLSQDLSKPQMEYLIALNLDESIFVNIKDKSV